MSTESDILFCLGDFNINYLDYSNYLSMNLYSILNSLNLKQVITEPTRVTATSATLIDLVITDNLCDILSTDVLDMHPLTDHCLVSCKVGLSHSAKPVSQKRYRDFKHFDVSAFERDLRAVEWNVIYNIPSIDDKVKFLNGNITAILDKHAPFKTSRFTKPYTPWLTDNVRLMIKLRNKALQRFKRSKSPAHWDYYKALRNMTTAAIKAEKKAYLEFTFRSNNAKTAWQTLRKMSIYGVSSDKTIPSNLQDVNEINKYFVEHVNSVCDNPDIINYYNNSCYE
ncbi:uncharacterized protein LOC116178327 [Photinus pyralis]|uniref:uncharacterized protein LOC116178327 n=1 Tax=Photinus pyralis TaxID=7054 RepID=UPI00126748C0|nr:uncharacterized protein LOC116178327 [Photinus pyralis]